MTSDFRSALNSTVCKIAKQLSCSDHVLWHGSLARGLEATSVSDVDLCLSLPPKPSERMYQLMDAKNKYQKLTNDVSRILCNNQQIPLSCLLITKQEVDWNIVKGCENDDFFSDGTQKVVVKGESGFFMPSDDTVYRRQAMRENQASRSFREWICNTQLTRKNFISGMDFRKIGTTTYGNDEEYFKGFCRRIDQTFNGTNDQNNGYQYLRNLILNASIDRGDEARNFITKTPTLDLEELPGPEMLMLMWEYVLDAALNKLDELIPPIDKIFKDYNAKVQRDWLKQWGYARDPEGIYLNKNGEALLDGDNSPISDWNLHQNRIVQEGLNAGSVEYANLFADNPNKLGPSDFDEFSESDAG
jgi:predicted nucleotidyltransferase